MQQSALLERHFETGTRTLRLKKHRCSNSLADPPRLGAKKARIGPQPGPVTCVSSIPVQRRSGSDLSRPRRGALSPQGSSRKWAAAFVALSLLGNSTAQAATAAARIDPLVALSVFGTSESRSAVCAAGASAAAAAGAAVAAQPGAAPGCVLPAVDAPLPPPVTEAVPPPPVAAAPVVAGAGIPIVPLLLGLAAVAAFAALVLDDDEEGEIFLPISP
jgi:hypothetical protein